MTTLLRHASWLCAPVLGLAAGLPACAQHQPVPHVATDFTRTDLAGKPVHLAALRGHVVLLNFWATWCAPCLAEMPVFSNWQREEQTHGVYVIGVSMDDDAAAAHAVVKRLALPYPVMMGDAPLATAYGGVLGLPVTFLIDRHGTILKRYDGAADLATMHRDLLQALR